MKLAISGASGFIGGHLMRSLAGDHRVLGLSRRAIPEGGYSWQSADISRPFQLAKARDVFIHAAAVADLMATNEEAERINLDGTRHALATAEKAGARLFVYISSASIYDIGQPKTRAPESFAGPSGCNNAYSRTKYSGERLVAESQMATVILRPHIVYGPRDSSVLPGLFAHIRFNRLILPIKKSAEISVTFVGNICAVVKQAIAKKSRGHKVYNLADASYTTNLAFLKSLLELEPAVRLWRFSPRLAKALSHLPGLLPLDATNIDQLNHDSSLDLGALLGDGYVLPYTSEYGLAELKKWYGRAVSYHHNRAQSTTVWPDYRHSPTY